MMGMVVFARLQKAGKVMKDLIKFYILNIPWSLYGIGLVFFILLLWICYSATKETRKRKPHDR